MIRKFFRFSRTASVAAPSPGDGRRVYAIGDVHGCLRELDDLLAAIDADDAARGEADTSLVFLGDLVDRGPDSAGVIERALAWSHTGANTHFLMGNHEEIFLKALDGDEKALRLFCRIGGRETILSYGIDADEYERLDYVELAERLSTLVPAAHRDFLAGFEDMVVMGDYAFVHAGIRPDVPLEEQRTSDLRWIRDTFLDHRKPHPKMIVHGHTIAADVDRRANRIGVDTGAYSSGRLSAVGIEGHEMWVLSN